EHVQATLTNIPAPSRLLQVSHAFHSPHLDPILDELTAVASTLHHQTPTIPVISNLTGQTAQHDPGYWAQQARGTVQWRDTLTYLAEQGVTTFLEIGPHNTLTALTREVLPDATALHTSHRTNGTNIDSVLAQTWIHGHGNHPAEPTNHLPDAPTYPFERNRYWLMTPPPATAGGTTHPHLTTAVHRADIDGTLHTGTLNPAVHTWLTEHVIGDTTLLPATAFAEMAIFAGDAVGYGRIEELTLRAPLPLDRTAALQVWVGEPDHQDRRPITVYARPTSTGSDEVWTCHATGHLGPDVDPPLPDTAPRPPAGAVAVDVDDLYERLEERGYRYGANFRRLTAAWRDGETIFAEVTVGKDTDLRGYGVHPALFDAALHCLGVTDDGAGRRLPVQWSGVSLHATGARSLRVRVTPAGDDEVAITITDPAGAPVLSVDALTLREVAGQETATSGLYTLVWKPVDGGRRGVVPGTVLLDAGAVPADRPGAAVAWVLEQVQQRLDGSEHLVVVTRGAVAVTDTDDPDPDQGAVW
ncbi:polyketide synthase dehydratase domain-containing protein, partial [Micromonospora zhanjiangensis]